MRFISRKNELRLEEDVVVKRLRDPQSAQREAVTLKALNAAGLAVPRLFGTEGNSIYLEYVPGVVYADLVDSMAWNQAVELAGWLAEHYRLTGRGKGDVNLRNFIWTGNRCVGIDFEDPPVNERLEGCFGRAAAFAATYRPAFTEEKARCLELLLRSFRGFGANDSEVGRAFVLELKAMNERRKRQVDLYQAAEFFVCCVQRLDGEEHGGGVS